MFSFPIFILERLCFPKTEPFIVRWTDRSYQTCRARCDSVVLGFDSGIKGIDLEFWHLSQPTETSIQSWVDHEVLLHIYGKFEQKRESSWWTMNCLSKYSISMFKLQPPCVETGKKKTSPAIKSVKVVVELHNNTNNLQRSFQHLIIHSCACSDDRDLYITRHSLALSFLARHVTFVCTLFWSTHHMLRC